MSMSLRALRVLPASSRLASPAVSTRAFSLSASRMAEGDTGSQRSGGSAQSDAFTKREQASEDYYVRQQEQQKLEALKKRIADQEDKLAQDRKEAEELTKKHK